MATKVKLIADNAVTAAMIDTTATPTFGGITVNGDATVTGDLNITGDLNSYNVTDLDVTDQTITLGAGQTEELSGGSGIIVDGSGASILWDETNDTFDINKGLNVDSDTFVVDNTNNRVGIGTTSPGRRLEVNSTQQIAAVISNNSNTNVRLGFEDANSSGDNFVAVGAVGDNFVAFAGGSERLRADSSGNVGIGTSSIDEKLHIEDSVDGEVLLKVQNTSTGSSAYAGLQLAGQGNNFLIKNWGDSVPAKTNQTEFIATAGNSYFVFTNNGSESMRIDNSGNVGIGTNNPTYKLEVAGDASFLGQDVLIDSQSGYKELRHTQTGENLAISSPESLYFIMDSNNDQTSRSIVFAHNNTAPASATELMRIGEDGNVGIGTTSVFDSNTRLELKKSGNCQFFVSSSDASGVRIVTSAFGTSYGKIGTFSNHAFRFDTNDTERMRITSGGTVAIGTASPNAVKLHVGDTAHNDLISGTQILATGSSAGAIGIGLANGNGTGVCNLLFGSTSDGNDGEISYNLNDKTMNFYTGGNTHAMTIEDDQTVCVNRTSKFGAAGTASMIVIQGSQATMRVGAANSNDFPLLAFYNGGLGNIGNIHTNGTTGVTYDTASDYRMKENVNYDWNGLSIINQLRPAKYNWIADDMDGIEEGFIAHEVQEILPYVVSGEKDAMEPAILYEEDDREVIAGTANVGEIKEEEKIKPQSMDYGRITPILVKAIQEQQTIIDDLKARIDTLENA